jgi:hypothetical protein
VPGDPCLEGIGPGQFGISTNYEEIFMKKVKLVSIACLAALILTASCSHPVSPNQETPAPSPLPSAHMAIADSIAAHYPIALAQTSDPKAANLAMLGYVSTIPQICRSGLNDDSTMMWVWFCDSGRWVWSLGMNDSTEGGGGKPLNKSLSGSSPEFPSGNNALIATIFSMTTVDGKIKADLESRGYKVTTAINENVTLDLLKYLQIFNFVYIHTHSGHFDDGGSQTFLETGETIQFVKAKTILVPYHTNYKQGEMYPLIDLDPKTGQVATALWCISGGFIVNGRISFDPNSAVVVKACNSLANDDLPYWFLSENADVFVGTKQKVSIDPIWPGMGDVFDALSGNNNVDPSNIYDAVSLYPDILDFRGNGQWCLMPHLNSVYRAVAQGNFTLLGVFGDQMGKVSVTGASATVKAWTDDQLLISIPSYTAGSTVTVSVNGLTSNTTALPTPPPPFGSLIGFWDYDFAGYACLHGKINYKADGTYFECWLDSCSSPPQRGSVSGTYTVNGDTIQATQNGQTESREFKISGDSLVVGDPSDPYSYFLRSSSSDCP